MPTTLGAAARHPAAQLEGVDDAAGFAGAVDDPPDESDEPDDFPDFSDEPDEPDDDSDEPDPLVAEPLVTDERESVRESVR
jgi:hypothetical protein